MATATATTAYTVKPPSMHQTMKDQCLRCQKPVYPTDKVGPLKDKAYFHQGCFKCYICGTRLTLKSYCNNRNDIYDQEVYCNGHVPLAGPHDPAPVLKQNGHQNGHNQSGIRPQLNGHANANGKDSSHSGSHNSINVHSPGGQYPTKSQGAGIEDMHMKHAMKAQALAKPYPKLLHPGARYIVDYDKQTRLELAHRQLEDQMYHQFHQEREKEDNEFSREIKEEWERALADLDQNKYNSRMQARDRDELIQHLTIKRDNRRATMQARRKERERSKTAELVDKQAREMMELYRQARQEVRVNDNEQTEQLNVGTDMPDNTSDVSYPTTPPPPQPAGNRKRDIYADTTVFDGVDQTAISVAQEEQLTFTDLMWALTQGCKSDVEKARAIYRWITVKNLNLMQFDGRLDANTPMGLLRGIKYGTESYHVLFKRLCSYAGLHCVVIKGYSKSAGYQPGMRFDDGRFRNTWNAVFLDGGWRFVQCNWGARHLVNAKDSPRGSDKGQRSDSLRYEYDDHYFMTDAEEFIYEFFPHQTEWQLLKRPITLQEFEQMPFVRSLFFRYGLSFVDHRIRAVVGSDSSGAATVALNMSPDAISNLIFHYNLRHYHNESTDHNGVSLKRFVMQSVVGHSVVFRVHTPNRGEYLLDIFANSVTTGEYLTGQPMKFKSVCKFKVVCDNLNVIMVPLPECASGEWGPAKCYRLFGLIPLSHEDAIINAKQQLEIRFQMSKPLAEFVAGLHKNNVDDRKLQKCVAIDLKGDQVTLKLVFPEEGQYGLDLYTRDVESTRLQSSGKNLLTHCCKYLINART